MTWSLVNNDDEDENWSFESSVPRQGEMVRLQLMTERGKQTFRSFEVTHVEWGARFYEHSSSCRAWVYATERKP